MSIRAVPIEKSPAYVEVVLCGVTGYSQPLAIINDQEMYSIVDCAIGSLQTFRLERILEEVQLELCRRHAPKIEEN